MHNARHTREQLVASRAPNGRICAGDCYVCFSFLSYKSHIKKTSNKIGSNSESKIKQVNLNPFSQWLRLNSLIAFLSVKSLHCSFRDLLTSLYFEYINTTSQTTVIIATTKNIAPELKNNSSLPCTNAKLTGSNVAA